MLCPNGHIRTPDGCSLFATTWYKSGFLLYVLLTPSSDVLLPKAAFDALPETKKRKFNKWLDVKEIPVNSIKLCAELVSKQNISYMRRLNILLGFQKFPIEAQEILKIVESALAKQWSINIDKETYNYNVALDKYLNFIDDGTKQRRTILHPSGNKSSVEKTMRKTSVAVYKNIKMISFYITKMYFCKQVDLFPGEWIVDFQGLRLNLTGLGDERFLGDGEFNYRMTQDKEWKIQICVDDFKNPRYTTNSSAEIMAPSLFMILPIVYWVI